MLIHMEPVHLYLMVVFSRLHFLKWKLALKIHRNLIYGEVNVAIAASSAIPQEKPAPRAAFFANEKISDSVNKLWPHKTSYLHLLIL